MRITIDTDLQCVIVPNSYYEQIDKLNEVIEAAGGNKLDYTQYIKDCFKNCFETKIIRQSDVSKRITPDEVKEFHRLYAIHGSYAEVARRTGRSANAIAKYIKMEKMPQSFGHAVRQTITK